MRLCQCGHEILPGHNHCTMGHPQLRAADNTPAGLANEKLEHELARQKRVLHEEYLRGWADGEESMRRGPVGIGILLGASMIIGYSLGATFGWF